MRKRPLPDILVSPEDAEMFAALTWYCSPSGYIRTMWQDEDGRMWMAYLHRLIAKAPKGMTVDHINGNKADNRRENLRVCTQKQNARAAGMRPSRNKTGFAGVHKVGKRWRAMIRVDNKGISLGMHASPEEAARAYDAAASVHFGQFAKLNFPTLC